MGKKRRVKGEPMAERPSVGSILRSGPWRLRVLSVIDAPRVEGGWIASGHCWDVRQPKETRCFEPFAIFAPDYEREGWAIEKQAQRAVASPKAASATAPSFDLASAWRGRQDAIAELLDGNVGEVRYLPSVGLWITWMRFRHEVIVLPSENRTIVEAIAAQLRKIVEGAATQAVDDFAYRLAQVVIESEARR